MSAATDLDAESGENHVIAVRDGVAIVAIVDWDATQTDVRGAQGDLKAELDYLTASGAIGDD